MHTESNHPNNEDRVWPCLVQAECGIYGVIMQCSESTHVVERVKIGTVERIVSRRVVFNHAFTDIRFRAELLLGFLTTQLIQYTQSL